MLIREISSELPGPCLCLMAALLLSFSPVTGTRALQAKEGAIQEPMPAGPTGAQTPIRMKINHYQVPCLGEAVQLCYVVKIHDQREWELFYGAIEGFDFYAWGHTYDIAVRREEVANPAQDGSSYRFVLSKVLGEAQVPKNTEFSFILNLDALQPYATNSTEKEFRLVGQVPLTCENEKVCTALSKALGAVHSVQATFRHAQAGRGILLIALADL